MRLDQEFTSFEEAQKEYNNHKKAKSKGSSSKTTPNGVFESPHHMNKSPKKDYSVHNSGGAYLSKSDRFRKKWKENMTDREE